MSHSHVLERLASDLKMAGRALGTRQQYLASLRRFEERIGKSADQSTQEDIRRWVEFLQTQPIGPERLQCHYSAHSFLFKKTLGRPEVVAFISMPRKDAPLQDRALTLLAAGLGPGDLPPRLWPGEALNSRRLTELGKALRRRGCWFLATGH